MKRATLALALLIVGLAPAVASADSIMFTSGLNTPALRVTFDPQPEPPGFGVIGGPTATLVGLKPTESMWVALLSNGSPLAVQSKQQLTDLTGAGLFGVRIGYGAAVPYYLEVLFDPQPEPPGIAGTEKWALVAFDPQPEPPGVVGVGPGGLPGVTGEFSAFIAAFDPQPEPPGLGNTGFRWFYQGSIVQGQFEGATFTLTQGEALFDLQPVPEPASLLLLGTGLAGLVRVARRRRP